MIIKKAKSKLLHFVNLDSMTCKLLSDFTSFPSGVVQGIFFMDLELKTT